MLNKNALIIKNKIVDNEPFALVRFGDGEKNIIDGVTCDRKGFKFNLANPGAKMFQGQLIASLEYDGGKNYMVGINPPELIPRAKSPIVSASLFVNQSYIDFLKEFVPIFKLKKVLMVCNWKANIKLLPFIPEDAYYIENNAWEFDTYNGLLANLKTEPKIVLVAGGAYSCTLIHRLWQKTQKHTLIDIGSVFDPFFYRTITRRYQERIFDYVAQSL